MKKISVSYVPVAVSVLWSWILIFIPTIIRVLEIAGCNYRFDNNNLIVERGIFTKKQETIPFYRIVDIRADRNIFQYGTIIIQDKNKYVELKYVANPLSVVDELKLVWETAKESKNVTHNEVF